MTDHGNLYGAIEFYKKAKRAGIKPILGVEAYLAPNTRFDKRPKIDDYRYHLILLAKNLVGWKNLIQLITKANLEGFYYKPRIDKGLLRQHSEGLIGLSACLSGEIPRLIQAHKLEEARKAALDYQEIFGSGNFYLEVGHYPNIPETESVKKELIKISKECGIPLVATQDIHYLKPEDAPYHEILLAVQTGNKLGENDRLSLRADDFSLRSSEAMIENFSDLPEAIENTWKIAEMCNVELELGKIHLPSFHLPPGEENTNSYLKKLVFCGADDRFPQGLSEEYKNRLEYELGVVSKTGFADYFLIVSDFIKWAKEHGIVVGPGRGSAAGSLVSYVLGITDIDPIKYDLLFERFLNPDRIQMPDIDIDFTDRRRDEVLAYITQKYGQDHVAQIITFGTMAARAAVRDAGRALGINYGFCDRLAKLIPFNAHLKEALKIRELADLYENNDDARRIIDAARKLEGLARHVSVHACGVVISPEPLIEYLPLQYAPQSEGIIITQFEMNAITEELGLLKMDLLGLKNLTIIEDTIRLVKERQREDISLKNLPLDDSKVFELLRRGDTTAVFQLESSGMRRYLKELKPNKLEDIIAMVALYRPGPMELIPSFINRKYGREEIKYLHPKLEPILKNTYGIGIYQEQMMRIARDLAGFSLAEADTLRKAIGKKIKVLLESQKEKLIKGMLGNGVDEKTAKKIWELFPPFARYGFNRSHAACYAMIGYQTAYLKSHYPIEFMTSLLNSDAGDTERIAFLAEEAKGMGIEILPPDINQSGRDFSPDSSKQIIRFGLAAIKNLGSNIVEAIINERGQNGPFQDIKDFLLRITHKDLNKKSLESLIKCGALDSLGVEKGILLYNIEELLKFNNNSKRGVNNTQHSLFTKEQNIPSLKLKEAPIIPLREKLVWEKELLGIFVSEHPLNGIEEKLKNFKIIPIKDVFNNQAAIGYLNIAGIVSKIQMVMTKLGQPMIFARLNDSSSSIEVIVFSDVLNKNPVIWKENNVVMVKGKMSQRNGESKLICSEARLI